MPIAVKWRQFLNKIIMYQKITKFITLALLFTLLGFSAMAQDVIILKNGDEIKSLVQEIGTEYVKYKRFDNQTGPTYNVAIVEIFMIKYQNGTKDVFNEMTKPSEQKPEQAKQTYQEEVAKSVSTSESSKWDNYENTETVSIPEREQSKKDVIVMAGFQGIQTQIKGVDHKRIFYVKYKKNGKEKDKKIKQKRVEFTLSFHENVKTGTFNYPLEMRAQDFYSLPTYYIGNSWVVFGTNRMSVLSNVQKNYPDLYKLYNQGRKQHRTGNAIYMAGALSWFFLTPIVGLPLMIGGSVTMGNANLKLSGAFKDYYSLSVNIGVCEKYGIIITPYNTSIAY